MDKYSMTGFDKKYAFICELTPSGNTIDNPTNDVNEIRRKQVYSYPDVNRIKTTKMQPIVPKNIPNKGIFLIIFLKLFFL